MVFVIATIHTNAGRREEVLAQFRKIVPLVCQEQGCQLYAPSIDIDTSIGAQIDMRGDVITVVEQWESIEDLEQHLMAPHMIDYRAAVKELVTSVDLQIVEPT